jgi:hypothetical protein
MSYMQRLSITKGIFVIVSIFGATILSARIVTTYNDFEFGFSGIYRAESFLGKNVSLLNNNEPADRIFFARHTMDFTIDALAGKCLWAKYPAIQFNFSIRNKAVWGDANSIAQTTDSSTQFLEEVGREHRHYIPRHIFWMREGWLQLSLNQIFSIPAYYEHTFTIGAFPFQLGRGISLGDAYAVGAGLLGFYTDGAIDQYAFGAKFSGNLAGDKSLLYDFYSSILSNKTGNLSDTAAKIRGQEYGRLSHPQRGFGRMNYLFAGRLIWKVFDQKVLGSLTFEPYWVYNKDPEQKIEFVADASSTLGTLGLAGEYDSERFAVGFEGAVNLGHQKVRGWDRNQITAQNRNGSVVLLNSHVLINVDPLNSQYSSDLKAYMAPYATGPVVDASGQPVNNGKSAQDLINGNTRARASNGKFVGVASGLSDLTAHTPAALSPAQKDDLFNATNRYRDPYTNTYKGAMFVADSSVYFFDKELQCSLTTGMATGDDNPNDEVIDGDFTGFIGLQELYSGKRVRSVFLLGGAGKLKRPLSAPSSEDIVNPFARVVSGFTDLIFCGGSIKWEPTDFCKKFSLFPNLLFYWKENTVKQFDAQLKKQIDQCARNFLGTELNIFTYLCLHENLKLYFVASLFVPGSHYDDVRGKPLDAEQDKALNRLDRTGFTEDKIPNLGNDSAFTCNLGLEFKF